jgi:argininosuccinate lyase
MPQKKNPDLTELIRAKVGRIHGAAQAVTLQLKGCRWPTIKTCRRRRSRSLQCRLCLADAEAGCRSLRARLRFNRERMNEAAQSGYLNAMAAATYLVHKGVPFRTAHEKIGNAVRFAIEKGVELGDLTLDELREFGPEFRRGFFRGITLNATLDCHDVIGGTARTAREQALDDARKNELSSDDTRTGEAVHAGA